MRNLFDYDGTIISVMNKIMYVVSANLLFLVCSIPVFTVGASAAAMYAVLFEEHKGAGRSIISSFFRNFRESFIPATLLWSGMLLTAGTLWINYRMTEGLHGAFEAVRVICNLVGLLILVLWIYAFPAMAYYKNNLRGYIHFALAVSISHLLQTFLLFAIQAGLPLLILYLAQYSSLFAITFLLCGLSLGAYLSIGILYQIFRRYGQETQ